MRWIIGLFVITALAGCLNAEDTPGTVEESDPITEDLDRRSAVSLQAGWEHVLPGGGQGIWVHEGLLYSTNGADLHIVDVSDPTAPADLGALEGVGARDVDVLEWDGVLYAVLAGSGRGMHVVDVSDPTEPVLATTVELPSAGVHNLATVPGTPYIYSSGASATRQIDVLDITDIDNPVVHTFDIPAIMNGVELNSDGCHDISVRVDLGRAYCAGGGGQYQTGGGETFIWDISEDPTDPVWVNFVDDDRIVYNHQAFVDDAGHYLIVNDENLGPNCVSADLPGLPSTEDPQVPFAAAWVWDISDESDPVLRGLLQNDAVTRHATTDPALLVQDANCGSHFGDLVRGTQQFVMGWYGGGTLLIDFSNPEEMKVIDYHEATGSTWDTRYFDGHVYHSSGDLQVTPVEFEDLPE